MKICFYQALRVLVYIVTLQKILKHLIDHILIDYQNIVRTVKTLEVRR